MGLLVGLLVGLLMGLWMAFLAFFAADDLLGGQGRLAASMASLHFLQKCPDSDTVRWHPHAHGEVPILELSHNRDSNPINHTPG